MKTKIIILSGVLISLFTVSYFFFASYQPKILRTLQEVKGIAIVSSDDLPYPEDAKKLSFFQTPSSKQTTFKTEKTPEEILAFYKNIYDGKNWRKEKEALTESLVTLRYKIDDEVVEINGVRQEDTDYTVVSIGLTEN